jgi:hypothetical protein
MSLSVPRPNAKVGAGCQVEHIDAVDPRDPEGEPMNTTRRTCFRLAGLACGSAPVSDGTCSFAMPDWNQMPPFSRTSLAVRRIS